MTAEQREYRARGGSEDFLELLFLNEKQQSYCSVNTGFLAHGRPIVPSAENRIRLRAPNRCTEFGTDPLIGMLEWLGRAVRENYDQEKFPGAELIIGDISAPRGGCLSGTGGKRGHLSHTTGQDVDLGFFIPTKKNPNPSYFQREFDPESNWWILKNLFRNPYACIKVIFLDRSLIRKLRQFAKNDLEWLQHEKFFRHMPGHKNHFHVRVKEEQRGKGCDQSPEPLDLEDLESLDGVQADET